MTKRGKSRMGTRKNLLKSLARDYDRKAKARARKAYEKKAYDGHDEDVED